MKTLYGSKSGQDVKVTVAVPVIANPPPQKSALRWLGPIANSSIMSMVFQQDVPYKHWINSSIPIINQNYFGNYTLKYNMTEVITITISAEGLLLFKFFLIAKNKFTKNYEYIKSFFNFLISY